MNSCSDRILCTSSMTSSTADEREEAQIRDDTELAYVKIFTTDMVILGNNKQWGCTGRGMGLVGEKRLMWLLLFRGQVQDFLSSTYNHPNQCHHNGKQEWYHCIEPETLHKSLKIMKRESCTYHL